MKSVAVAHIEGDPLAVRLVGSALALIDCYEFSVDVFNSIKAFSKPRLVKTPDVILLDLDLPDVQGVDAIRAVRREYPLKPVVVITGKDETEWRAAARKLGVSDYLLKSELNLITLQRALTTALESRGQILEAISIQNFVGSINRPVVLTDKQGQVVFWNKAAAELTGLAEEQVLGQPLPGLFSRKETSEKYLEMQDAVWDGQVSEELLSVRTASGEYRTICLISSPMYNAQGQIVGRVDTAELNVENGEADAKLVRREKRYRQMARRFYDETLLKSQQYEAHQQMVNSLVHDLRSPLSALNLLMGIPGDPPDFSRLDPVTWNLTKTQLQLAVELCNQLLDIRRIERGQFKLRPERQSLRQTIETAQCVFELLAAEKGIQVKVNAADEECLLDHSMLRRILMNLIDNALKFSPEGSRLIVAARMYPDKVTIKVTDQGPGIAPDQLERVFDLYWTKKESGIPGRGVGLAFCRHAAEAMGGSISVDSKPGAGTAFTLRLPLIEAQEQFTVLAAAAGG